MSAWVSARHLPALWAVRHIAALDREAAGARVNGDVVGARRDARLSTRLTVSLFGGGLGWLFGVRVDFGKSTCAGIPA